MSAIEIGTQLVQLANDGKDSEAVDRLYSEKIVSIEGQGSEELPARMEGIQAIRGKHQWWYDNHEIHSTSASGPFCGQRRQMSEVGIFTIADGKIVQEEFLYKMG